MTKSIIIKKYRSSFNYESLIKKNTTILATYYALYAENKHLKKALMTITIGTESIQDLRDLRKEFMKKLNSLLRKKAYKHQELSYFSNIEFGEDKGELSVKGIFTFNPHLHIQFFYEDITPINQAFKHIEKIYKLDNSCITLPESKKHKKNLNYDYVVKEYKLRNFDYRYEKNKKKFSNKKSLHTSSRKSVSNYVIKYLYSYLSKYSSKQWNSLKSYERYEFILHNIKEGNINITSKKERPSIEYKIVKNSAIHINLENIKTAENDVIKNIITKGKIAELLTPWYFILIYRAHNTL